MGSMTVSDTPAELVARSNRLGADPRNTNYAGGNTSAKGTATDPVTQQPVDLVWVKGSGGDLGTLTAAGLAVLRQDRLNALVDVYPGVDREDEMVAAFDYCLHGKGGAAPSIDTAMHGLVDAPHVDHLHPDSGIALATAADGEKLTADRRVLRGSRRLGAVAAARIPARPGHRAGEEGQPTGDRGDPRRPRHHRLG
jgi:rhamnose utilization protein RhaD (predicted bifunctional aldolase and dehydrogenase)